MINKSNLGYKLRCDNCDNNEVDGFDDFSDAVDYKKDKSNGWKSKKIEDEWKDFCPNCN